MNNYLQSEECRQQRKSVCIGKINSKDLITNLYDNVFLKSDENYLAKGFLPYCECGKDVDLLEAKDFRDGYYSSYKFCECGRLHIGWLPKKVIKLETEKSCTVDI